MNKTIMMLDDMARLATSNREIMLFVADKSIVDKFVGRYGGERCVGEDGNPFILYEGCKIRYVVSANASKEICGLPINRIDSLSVENELQLHLESIPRFRRWGIEVE